jgi:hypothetical protein
MRELVLVLLVLPWCGEVDSQDQEDAKDLGRGSMLIKSDV